MVQILNPQIYQTEPLDFLVGGKVYSYIAGTSTPKNTYQSAEDAKLQRHPNTNPVILDSRGRARIVTDGPTKLVVKDQNDIELWTVDDIDSSNLDIEDANSNSILTFNAVANAVNNFKLSNAKTGDSPIISAEGESPNINIKLKTKGTGNIEITEGGISLERDNLVITAGDITLNSGNITITSGDLNVDNLDSLPSFYLLNPGNIAWFAGSTAPSGWLECDGSAISRTTYAELFSVIGTTFGAGNGSTTFNLPSQARRTLVGKGGTGTATLANTIGSTGGAETHTLTIAEMPSHNHQKTFRQINVELREDTGTHHYNPDIIQNTGSTGGGGSHNIMQPSLVMMMVIRA